MNQMRGSDDEKLDALFRAYHGACPVPEASANFMPNLWAKIESRQTFTFSIRRMAAGFVTAALALSLALGVYASIPHSNPNSPQTYLEALAEARPLDAPEIVGTAHLDPTGR
jgi:Ser/Thr protein kinase RdoA (MazF antagonist)